MEAKKQVSLRRKYDAAFKAEVLKLVANGQSVAYVSQALGLILFHNFSGKGLTSAEFEGLQNKRLKIDLLLRKIS